MATEGQALFHSLTRRDHVTQSSQDERDEADLAESLEVSEFDTIQGSSRLTFSSFSLHEGAFFFPS